MSSFGSQREGIISQYLRMMISATIVENFKSSFSNVFCQQTIAFHCLGSTITERSQDAGRMVASVVPDGDMEASS